MNQWLGKLCLRKPKAVKKKMIIKFTHAYIKGTHKKTKFNSKSKVYSLIMKVTNGNDLLIFEVDLWM